MSCWKGRASSRQHSQNILSSISVVNTSKTGKRGREKAHLRQHPCDQHSKGKLRESRTQEIARQRKPVASASSGPRLRFCNRKGSSASTDPFVRCHHLTYV